MTTFAHDGHTYWFHQDTGDVWIAHRDDGKNAWWWSDHYGCMIFFARSLSWLKKTIISPSLFGDRVVWANGEADALSAWHESQEARRMREEIDSATE